MLAKVAQDRPAFKNPSLTRQTHFGNWDIMKPGLLENNLGSCWYFCMLMGRAQNPRTCLLLLVLKYL